jgi:enamine deaminase RidA (YjgF/YER057c/UK114 family)
MRRVNLSSGTEWESRVGYSRAVRTGNVVHVAGTTATDENGNPIDGGPYEQTKQALSNVSRALDEADASIEDVTRTRLFVTDIDEWEEIGHAHGEVFGDVRPAATMVEVNRLIDPDLCVEIEVDAVVDDE